MKPAKLYNPIDAIISGQQLLFKYSSGHQPIIQYRDDEYYVKVDKGFLSFEKFYKGYDFS
jgi:hypothetical protein